jgi:hypothetical protein
MTTPTPSVSSTTGQLQPNWPLGYVPAVAEWETWWASKQDSGGMFNVISFGATGDGSTSDTTAVQAAITAAGAAPGGTVYFPAGTYLVGTLNLNLPVTLLGCNRDDAILQTQSNTQTTLNVTSGGVNIIGLGFSCGTLALAGGSMIDLAPAASGVLISECQFSGYFIGITVGSASIVDIDLCSWTQGVVGSSVGVLVNGGTDDLAIRHGVMNASPYANIGIQLVNCGDCVMEDMNIIGQTTCLYISPGSSQQVDTLYCTDCFFDTSSGTGLAVSPTGTGGFYRSHFIGCWFSSHADGAVLTSSGSTVIDGIDFIDCEAYLNTNDGLAFVGCTNIKVIGGKFAANGGSGLSFTGCTNWIVSGARSGPCSGFGGNAYGLYVAGAGNDYIIGNSNLLGNTTSNYHDVTTGTPTTAVANNLS